MVTERRRRCSREAGGRHHHVVSSGCGTRSLGRSTFRTEFSPARDRAVADSRDRGQAAADDDRSRVGRADALAATTLHRLRGSLGRDPRMKYTLNAGDVELRAQIAAHYAYPEPRDAECVCITTGSEEAMYSTIQTLLQPGRDTLLVVEPAYPAYARSRRSRGSRSQRVGMAGASDFATTARGSARRSAARRALIVIGSPCQPDRSRAAATRTRGGSLRCSRERDVWVLFDELYRELTYVAEPGWLRELSAADDRRQRPLEVQRAHGPADRLARSAEPPLIALATQAHALIATRAEHLRRSASRSRYSAKPARSSEQAAWYRDRRHEVCRPYAPPVCLRRAGRRVLRLRQARRRRGLVARRAAPGRRVRRRDGSRDDVRLRSSRDGCGSAGSRRPRSFTKALLASRTSRPGNALLRYGVVHFRRDGGHRAPGR